MSLQRMIAKAIASLPGGMIVNMAGGKPMTIEGRTLEPQLQLVAWNGRNAPPMSTLPAEMVQQAVKAQLALFQDKLPGGVGVEEFTIPGPDANQIPVRLYTPASQDPRHPLIV